MVIGYGSTLTQIMACCHSRLIPILSYSLSQGVLQLVSPPLVQTRPLNQAFRIWIYFFSRCTSRTRRLQVVIFFFIQCGHQRSLPLLRKGGERRWQNKTGVVHRYQATCCLTAPNHYLTQCRIVIKIVLWHSLESNFKMSTRELNLLHMFGDYTLKINGNIFRVTGLLWGEFTGHRWIPLTKASGAELWCFRWSVPEKTVE